MSETRPSSGAVVSLGIDVIEHEVPRLPVQDHRSFIGGRMRHGLLRLRTAEDVEGLCFIGAFGEDPSATIGQIDRSLRSLVVGLDVTDREWLWSQAGRLAGHLPSLRPGGACVDAALWDLAGKLLGVPVAHLLGVAPSSMPAYATHPPLRQHPEEVVEDVLAAGATGFTAYKLHPGRMPVAQVAALAISLREAVGDEMELMLNPGNAYRYDEALFVGRALDRARFLWFEDPLPVGVIDPVVDLATCARHPHLVERRRLVLTRADGSPRTAGAVLHPPRRHTLVGHLRHTEGVRAHGGARRLVRDRPGEIRASTWRTCT